jgi:hypothetical protein
MIRATPESVDFGDARVDVESKQTIVFSNPSAFTVTVVKVAIDGRALRGRIKGFPSSFLLAGSCRSPSRFARRGRSAIPLRCGWRLTAPVDGLLRYASKDAAFAVSTPAFRPAQPSKENHMRSPLPIEIHFDVSAGLRTHRSSHEQTSALLADERARDPLNPSRVRQRLVGR